MPTEKQRKDCTAKLAGLVKELNKQLIIANRLGVTIDFSILPFDEVGCLEPFQLEGEEYGEEIAGIELVELACMRYTPAIKYYP